MKLFTFSFLLLLLITPSIFSQSLEETLFECLVYYYEDEEIEIVSELDRIESYMIDSGVIKDGSGESFYSFYQNIVEKGEVSTEIDNEKFKRLLEVPSFGYSQTSRCQKIQNEIDSEKVQESKILELKNRLQKLETGLDITPKTIASVITEVLSPNDFEESIHRANALLTMLFTGDPIDEIQLESKTGNNEDDRNQLRDTSSFPKFEIELDSENRIFANSEQLNLDILPITLESFLSGNLTEHNVIISTSRDSAYRIYIEILDAVMDVYEKLRDEESIKRYGLNFKDLNDNKRETIQDIIPKIITIESPDD